MAFPTVLLSSSAEPQLHRFVFFHSFTKIYWENFSHIVLPQQLNIYLHQKRSSSFLNPLIPLLFSRYTLIRKFGFCCLLLYRLLPCFNRHSWQWGVSLCHGQWIEYFCHFAEVCSHVGWMRWLNETIHQNHWKGRLFRVFKTIISLFLIWVLIFYHLFTATWHFFPCFVAQTWPALCEVYAWKTGFWHWFFRKLGGRHTKPYVVYTSLCKNYFGQCSVTLQTCLGLAIARHSISLFHKLYFAEIIFLLAETNFKKLDSFTLN